MQILLNNESKSPFFSNLIEQDSGLVTAGDIYTSTQSGKNDFNSKNKTKVLKE